MEKGCFLFFIDKVYRQSLLHSCNELRVILQMIPWKIGRKEGSWHAKLARNVCIGGNSDREGEEEVKEGGRFKEGVKVLSETSLQWILHSEMLAWASNKQFEAF